MTVRTSAESLAALGRVTRPLSVEDAAERRAVLVTRPGRPTVVARLLSLPGVTGSRRRSKGRSPRVIMPGGGIVSVPLECIELLPEVEGEAS